MTDFVVSTVTPAQQNNSHFYLLYSIIAGFKTVKTKVYQIKGFSFIQEILCALLLRNISSPVWSRADVIMATTWSFSSILPIKYFSHGKIIIEWLPHVMGKKDIWKKMIFMRF